MSYSRRSIIKMFMGGLFGAAMTVTPVRKALAGLGWCRADPIVRIDGRRLDIGVEALEAMLDNRTAPVKIRVQIPEESSYALLYADNGFGLGYDIDPVRVAGLEREPGRTQYRVRVNCPSSGNELVRIYSDPLDSNHGSSFNNGFANDWITTSGSV